MDILQKIKSAKVDTRISSKSGKDYHMLVLDFGSYKFETFLKTEQAYIIQNMAK